MVRVCRYRRFVFNAREGIYKKQGSFEEAIVVETKWWWRAYGLAARGLLLLRRFVAAADSSNVWRLSRVHTVIRLPNL
jgi:hypothetical protein